MQFRLPQERVERRLKWVYLNRENALAVVTNYGVHGKRREADGEIFRAFFTWGAVAYPLAFVGDYGLSGADVEGSAAVLDSQLALNDDGEFIEARCLAGFNPSTGTAHVSDRERFGVGVHAADVFVDQFGLVSGGFNSRGSGYQSRHGCFRTISEWLRSASIT